MSFFGRDLKLLERICLKPFSLVVIDLFTPVSILHFSFGNVILLLKFIENFSNRNIWDDLNHKLQRLHKR